MTSEVQIERIEHFIGSSDGTSQLRVLLWIPYLPENELKGIVQIVHGMEEHIDRYDEFARFLARNGFVVGAHDHVGHGKSVLDARDLGHITLDQGDAGARQRCRPCSSGAVRAVQRSAVFHLRAFHGKLRHARLLERTCQRRAGRDHMRHRQPACAARTKRESACAYDRHGDGGAIQVEGARFDGAGGFARAIENPRTPLDWISVDPAVVDAYIDDPLCGVMFTVGGYAALTGVVARAVDPRVAARVPKDLPLLFIAGAEDPVGENGKAVVRAVELYRDAGMKDVSLILYPGMRHEILNEPGKQTVYADVLAWLCEHAQEGN